LVFVLSEPENFPIYYTLDGTTPVDAQFKPTAAAERYQGPVTILESATLVAVALDGSVPSDTLTRFFTKSITGSELPPPSAIPSGRLFQDTLLVTLRSADPSIGIRYTLNGDIPNQASPLYQKPLRLDTTVILQAIAVKTGFKTSKVMLENYVLSPDTPTMSPKGGRYFGAVQVTLSSRSRKAGIFYTLDGSNPLPGTSAPYLGPIRLDHSAVIKAIAVAGNLASPVRTESYEISPRADTLLVPGGNFTPGGGYSFQHPGLTQSAARIVLAPPDTVVVKGFQDIPFAMILSSAVESDPFPRIVFTKPATDKKALYRIGKDGRPLFISDAFRK
jgi:hypothetical protein